MSVLETVETWLVDEVIGWNLCPFAAAPHRTGGVWITETQVSEVNALIEVAALELAALAEHTEEDRSTTLIAAPAFTNWDDFVDAIGGIEAFLEDSGADELFQVVGFHPDAVYVDAEPDDPANRTARAPVPVVHILRADAVERVVTTHPDAAGISEINAQRLRSGEIG